MKIQKKKNWGVCGSGRGGGSSRGVRLGGKTKKTFLNLILSKHYITRIYVYETLCPQQM